MATQDTEGFILEEPDAQLARMFVEQYLRGKGVSLKTICDLPEEEARQVMVEASTYASVRLAEIRDKAEFLQSLHGTTEKI